MCRAGFGHALCSNKGQSFWGLWPDSCRSAGGSPAAPSLERLLLSSAVLRHIWMPTRVIWSLVQLPNHSFGNVLSATNKAPFVQVPFPKLGVPVCKINLHFYRPFQKQHCFLKSLCACTMSGRASWHGERSPARSKGRLCRHDFTFGTCACLYRSLNPAPAAEQRIAVSPRSNHKEMWSS